jgi:hypothetical protein
LVDKSLGDGALDLLETLFLILASSVWDVHLGLNTLNIAVVDQRLLGASHALVRPFSEQKGLDSIGGF